MRTATTIFQMLLRIAGTLALILGIIFWTNNLRNLTPLHMLLGLIIVISLWVLAAMSARAGGPKGFVAVSVLWGAFVLWLGLTQAQLLLGDWHWVIQVLHLVVGIGALAQGERHAAIVKKAQKTA